VFFPYPHLGALSLKSNRLIAGLLSLTLSLSHLLRSTHRSAEARVRRFVAKAGDCGLVSAAV
jgi:hypothetical protein